MNFSDLSITEGDTVYIYYDDHAIQHINKGLISLIGKRTGSTDLLAASGEPNRFRFMVDGAAAATFKVRGLWL